MAKPSPRPQAPLAAPTSYLKQVRQLRLLAVAALGRYRISVQSLKFIQHGENTTFRVRDQKGQSYLLRIHRGGYHTEEAIGEELDWLAQLSADSSLQIPKPVRSKKGQLLEKVADKNFPEARVCCLFEWIEGQHIRKAVRPVHLGQLGKLIAQIQRQQPPKKSRHRNYWLAEGLVGVQPKFGSIDHVVGATVRQQQILTSGRRQVFKALKNFAKKHPQRCGLIHADLHFGNLLVCKGRLAAIDFDDCGQGFYAYDVAVSLLSLQNKLGPARQKEFPAFREALLQGYRQIKSWDAEDDRILLHLFIARELMFVSWLHSRKDNPRLEKYLRPAIQRAVKKIQKQYPEL